MASGQVLSQFPLAFARRFEGHPAEPIQVVKPTFGAEAFDASVIKATWLGHAVRRSDARMHRKNLLAR